MTDNFLQKLEEKVIALLEELEMLRKDLSLSKQENANLKAEKLNYSKKLQGLIGLLDSLEVADNRSFHANEIHLADQQEEYAAV